MSETYRLTWEMVGLRYLSLYSDADPQYYSHTQQIVPNSEIPDEHWHPVSKETDDPWGQYRTLSEWAVRGEEFVRNVRLEKQTNEPTWERVQPGPRGGKHDQDVGVEGQD